MAFTYGTVNKCKTADGSASNVYEVRFGWELVTAGQSSQNPPTGQVKLQLEVRSTSSSYKPWGYNQTTTIDGTSLGTKTFDLRSTNTWQVFGTRTINVTYNNDGTYSVEKSGSFTASVSGARPKSGSASVQVTLPTIPRYTSISSFTVSKRNETSLTFNWQTADTIDYAWYSTNNGSSWTGVDVTDGTSGSFTVSSLSPNTTYQCKLRVRRKDSQLTTDSSAVSQTTNSAPTQSLRSKNETSISMNWSCDTNADYIWYSKDNGSNWTAVGSVSGTSGYYTISGLSANTSYNIKTRVRRSATQTNYDTSASSQTTYNYPYISAVSSSNLTIGNSQTLTLYNPLSRSCTVYMKKDSSSGTQLYSGSTSGTSITFTPTASTLYSSIPSATYGNCVYYVVCSSPSHASGTTSGKYVVSEASNKPTLSSNTFTDTNSTTTALTGSSSKIVLNGSTLQISVTIAGKNYASISTIKIEGSSRTVTAGGSGANLTGSATYSITKPTKSSFSVDATDSRGLTYSGTISIASGNVVNYIPLTIVGVGSRNQPTDGKINISSSGKYFNGSFGSQSNTLTTSYKWKEASGSYSSAISLANTTSSGTHSEAQVQLTDKDYTKNYYIEFTATDKLNTVTSTVLVTKGVPVFNWDNDEFNINVDSKLKNIVVDSIRTKNMAGSWRIGGINSTNGSIDYTYTDGRITNFIEVDFTNISTYTLSHMPEDKASIFVAAYNANRQFLGRTVAYKNLGISTIYLTSSSFGKGTPQGTGNIKYLAIVIYNIESGYSLDNLASAMQLEEGSIATTYAPYQGLLDETNIKNKNLVVGGIRSKNILNLQQCSIEMGVLNSDGSIKSSISNSYYTVIVTTYLNNFLLANKGKTITFSMNEGISGKFMTIVIEGTRSGGSTYQEMIGGTGERYASGIIATDFTTITRVDFRFNRSSSPFTDTSTTRTNFMVELDTLKPTDYVPYQELNNMEGYSTNEVKIGTWIDGKPLYRKVITYTNSSSIGASGSVVDISIPHGISNFSQCVSISGVTTSANILPILSIQTGQSILSQSISVAYVDGNNITLRLCNYVLGSRTFYFTMVYAKRS